MMKLISTSLYCIENSASSEKKLVKPVVLVGTLQIKIRLHRMSCLILVLHCWLFCKITKRQGCLWSFNILASIEMTVIVNIVDVIYHTIQSFNPFPNKPWFFYVSAVNVFWKYYGKRRNCSWRTISPFPIAFSTHLKNFLPFSSHLKLSSANSLNVEKSKIRCLGKGYNNPKVDIWTIWRREGLVKSIFYSSQNVFYSSKIKFQFQTVLFDLRSTLST